MSGLFDPRSHTIYDYRAGRTFQAPRSPQEAMDIISHQQEELERMERQLDQYKHKQVYVTQVELKDSIVKAVCAPALPVTKQKLLLL